MALEPYGRAPAYPSSAPAYPSSPPAYPSSAPPPDYGYSSYGYGGYPPPGYGYPPPMHPPPHYGAYGAPPPGHPPPHGYGYPPPPGYPGHYPPPPGWPPPPHGYWPPPHGHMAPGYGREASRSRSPRRDGKYTCRFFIGIENDNKFKVARRIIGASGANMKEIVRKSGDVAKLRLRGKGSGFAERDTGEESQEPLQLCISCPTQRGYDIARKLAEELLLTVYDEYETYCSDHNLDVDTPTIRMTERHLSGEASGAQGSGGGGPSGKRGNRRGQRKPKAAPAPKDEDVDRGEPPEGAPGVEEIEKLISERNACRKRGEYSKADEIRDDLKDRGVVLSDEKGAHGDGLTVTSWRYWHA